MLPSFPRPLLFRSYSLNVCNLKLPRAAQGTMVIITWGLARWGWPGGVSQGSAYYELSPCCSYEYEVGTSTAASTTRYSYSYDNANGRRNDNWPAFIGHGLPGYEYEWPLQSAHAAGARAPQASCFLYSYEYE